MNLKTDYELERINKMLDIKIINKHRYNYLERRQRETQYTSPQLAKQSPMVKKITH